jgi:calcineurin-like phosphoesterase family protein
MTVFFTSDTHFRHRNIIKHDGRPYSSADEMNAALIANWNSKVQSNDTVFHLGDVGVGAAKALREILDRLNGRIYLIKGNHDDSATRAVCRDRFEWIKDYYFATFRNGEIKIALFHYALRVWDRCHRGSWHLYGHSHGRLPPEDGRLCFDIGVNSWNYYPLSFDEVCAKMETRRIKLVSS